MAIALQLDFLLSGIRDDSNKPLSGGKVYFYETDGTTPKNVWLDANQNTPAEWPLILDEAGCATVYGFGYYDVRIYTSTNTLYKTFDSVYWEITPVNQNVIQLSDFGSPSNANAAFTAAFDYASGNQFTVYIGRGEWMITTDLTVPSNINLRFEFGASINSNNASSVYYDNSVLQAPYSSIHGSGLNVVDFGGANPFVPDVWQIGGGPLGSNFYGDIQCLGYISATTSIKTPEILTISGDLTISPASGITKILYQGSTSLTEFSESRFYFVARPTSNSNYDVIDFRLESTLGSKNTALTATWQQSLGWDSGGSSTTVFKMVHEWVSFGSDTTRTKFFTKNSSNILTETFSIQTGNSVTVASNLALTANSIQTTSGNLNISPQSGQTVFGATVISSGQIATSGGYLTLAPASGVVKIGNTSISTGQIATASGDLTLSPSSGNVVLGDSTYSTGQILQTHGVFKYLSSDNFCQWTFSPHIYGAGSPINTYVNLFFKYQSTTGPGATFTQNITVGQAIFDFGFESGGHVYVSDGYIAIMDGIGVPSTIIGMASIYIDGSDGDLKIKFSDGTIKTIVTD